MTVSTHGRRLATVAALLALLSPAARAGGFSPEEARARMTVPEGFSASVFASEPEVRQPVAACFDERGRMWVIEYLQYPNPAGLTPVTVDQYLRTEYDRVPEPPPQGPRGADRIKILEDTDGDGKADEVTTFVEGLNLASAIAVGHGGVFVGQAPYLLFYPDRDRDDRPDGDPEVLLSGFGLQDAHATVNSLAWGPDGWLYGAQGSTVTARIRGVEFQQGIWRYHPVTRRFELFAEGGGNTWGLDFDRAGQAFGSSNSSFIVFHMVQGGYYWKGFAKHGPLHNPHTFGYFDSLAFDGTKPGGHVTPGGIIYKADAFPESFRDAFLGANLLANTVYWYLREPRGSSYSLRLGGTLLDAHDPWFRPIDLLTGPDGSVYVVDWYDQRASHLDPRDTWDRSNGRIYNIRYRGTRPVEPFDLAARTSAELVDLRTSANAWWPEMALRILAERGDRSLIPRLKGLLAGDRDEAIALRDLGMLYVSGGLDEPTALGLLDHPLPVVRRWVARLLGDDARMSDPLRRRLVALARDEPDPAVRSQIAASCQRWDTDAALAILKPLMLRSDDLDDPHIPLLIWWALERQARADRGAVVALVAEPQCQASALVRRHLQERLARLLAELGDFGACARLFAATPDAEGIGRAVAGMEKGLEGKRLDGVPEGFAATLTRLWESTDRSPAVVRLAARLGLDEGRREAIRRASDAATPADERRALIALLGQVGGEEIFDALLTLFARDGDDADRLALLDALAGDARPAVADAVLAAYPTLPAKVRARAVDLLATRPATAERLVGAIAAGVVAAADLRPDVAARIVGFGNPELTARLESAWGKVPGANSEAKQQRIAEVRGILPEGDKGDASRGREVFLKTCAGCHRLFGEGEQIGPELTGAERGNLDFLLTSLVDPSSAIRKEYQAQTLALEDGRVLSGLIVEESGTALTFFDSEQRRTVVPRSEIAEQKPADVSLMPEGLLDTLTETQVRDLFRYLQSGGPAKR